MVTNVTTDKLCTYNFLSSTASKTAKSSAASGSSSSAAPKEDDTNQAQEEGERNEDNVKIRKRINEETCIRIVEKMKFENAIQNTNISF